jgi:hypothetical protein
MKQYFVIFILTAVAHLAYAQQPAKKYDWIPTECAPKDYPVQIYSGNLLYGSTGGSSYIPDGTTINNGWGEEGSLNVAGDAQKEAPHTLIISWRSFAEKKDYSGKFKLNTVLINALFEKGFPNEHINTGHDNYKVVKVGLAPGGVIVVWLSGVGHQIEVGRYQATEAKGLNWKAVLPDMIVTMNQYNETVIKDLPLKIQQQIAHHKIPFGKWDNWRTRYNWKPELTGSAVVSELVVRCYNKEVDDVIGKRLISMPSAKKAAPEQLEVYWKNRKNRKMLTEINFDEREVYALLTHIKTNEEARLQIDIDKEKQKISVALNTAGQTYPFKQLVVNTYLR